MRSCLRILVSLPRRNAGDRGMVLTEEGSEVKTKNESLVDAPKANEGTNGSKLVGRRGNEKGYVLLGLMRGKCIEGLPKALGRWCLGP